MQTDSLAVVRATKLDLAQWIASGIGKCPNPATSLCLARYAAAQLESAALIPMSAPEKTAKHQGRSLLRRELKNSKRLNSSECAMVLSRVSQAMITVLATGSANSTVAHLIRHEAKASREIRALCRG